MEWVLVSDVSGELAGAWDDTVGQVFCVVEGALVNPNVSSLDCVLLAFL